MIYPEKIQNWLYLNAALHSAVTEDILAHQAAHPVDRRGEEGRVGVHAERRQSDSAVNPEISQQYLSVTMTTHEW